MPEMMEAIKRTAKTVWKTVLTTFRIYGKIGGEQSAAAFAYYALFSMFPLVALLLALGSLFFAPEDVHAAIEQFAPVAERERQLIFSTVQTMERARGGVGAVSIVILMWTSLRFFQALVRAVNQAWDTETIPWWQMPLKNLMMIAVVGSAFVLGILAPALIQATRHAIVALDAMVARYFPSINLHAIFAILDLSRYLVSGLVLFYAFVMLYKLAPRRKVLFSEVWLAALIVTTLLQILQVAFVNILPRFVHYSAIYGSIGGLMLLLLWIYITGQVIILGGCFSVAQAKRIEGKK